MIILMDIGNTRTKYCIVNENESSAVKAVLNEVLSNEFFNDHFVNVSKILVASVSHKELTGALSAWCQINEITYQRVVSEVNKNQVISGYQQPNQLGVDRWLALIGVADAFPNKNILVIDAGTATTVDLLASNGQHQGGWILAGVTTLVSSVLSQTTRVQANDKEEEESLAFGFNTSENVHNAAWAATIGLIDLAITQAQQQGFILDEVIFTGGNGALLSPLLSHQSKVIDELVLKGLHAYI
jgi:type III pantothenate kinase